MTRKMQSYGSKLIEDLESEARKTFTLDQAMSRLGLKRNSVIEVISRLRKKGRLVTLTPGFYAILHPSEKKHGLRPLTVIDDLMKRLGKEYYVGLLSAADFWGAAHQKPMTLQVVIKSQMSFRKSRDLKIKFHYKSNYPRQGIVIQKTESGFINVSSPALTALDVLSYEKACGGFDNVSLVIHDLIEKLDPKDLLNCSQEYGQLAIVQRLGYLLEAFATPPKIINPLKKWLQKARPSRVLLLPSLPREGKTHPIWQVIENAALDLEI